MSAYPGDKPAEGVSFSLSALADASANGEGAPLGVPVSWKRLKLEHRRTGERCWACEVRFGVKTTAKVPTHLVNLQVMHDRLKGSGDAAYMYKQLATYQRKVIRKEKLEHNEECILWSADMARTHFESHVIVPRDQILSSVETLVLLEAEIKSIVICDVNGRRTVDNKNLESILKIIALKKSLLATDTAKLIKS